MELTLRKYLTKIDIKYRTKQVYSENMGHKMLKKISILILLLLLASCSTENSETQETKIEESPLLITLTTDSLDLYIGQTFDPYNYIDESIKFDVSISNNVDVNRVGDYTVVYSTDNDEKTLSVHINDEPIHLSVSELTLDFGSTFDPRSYINNYSEINIINPVDTHKSGTYTVTYSLNDFTKTLKVIVKETKIEQASDWLSDQLINLNLLNHRVIEVDKCNLSGGRDSNVAVNVGYGDREYWAFTNEYGQLIVILADKITRQNESTEVMLGDGRYCADEAHVVGTEDPNLDQGHVIADSLGGVSNAYNITPENSNLNRYGDQAYMESSIRSANGASHFIALISYPNTSTQTPSHYKFSYIINGNNTTDEFDNVDPNPVNTTINSEITDTNDISSIDTNHNGTVTIAEAEAAGFSMPIYSDHWLYPYMRDGDNDGMVGE